MRLCDVVKALKPGQRIRMSEIDAVEPLDPEKNEKCEGPSEAGVRRYWTPVLTDAQLLAYWNRIVLKMGRLKGGKTIYVIVTGSDGAAKMEGTGLCLSTERKGCAV